MARWQIMKSRYAPHLATINQLNTTSVDASQVDASEKSAHQGEPLSVQTHTADDTIDKPRAEPRDMLEAAVADLSITRRGLERLQEQLPQSLDTAVKDIRDCVGRIVTDGGKTGLEDHINKLDQKLDSAVETISKITTEFQESVVKNESTLQMCAQRLDEANRQREHNIAATESGWKNIMGYINQSPNERVGTERIPDTPTSDAHEDDSDSRPGSPGAVPSQAPQSAKVFENTWQGGPKTPIRFSTDGCGRSRKNTAPQTVSTVDTASVRSISTSDDETWYEKRDKETN